MIAIPCVRSDRLWQGVARDCPWLVCVADVKPSTTRRAFTQAPSMKKYDFTKVKENFFGQSFTKIGWSFVLKCEA